MLPGVIWIPYGNVLIHIIKWNLQNFELKQEMLQGLQVTDAALDSCFIKGVPRYKIHTEKRFDFKTKNLLKNYLRKRIVYKLKEPYNFFLFSFCSSWNTYVKFITTLLDNWLSFMLWGLHYWTCQMDCRFVFDTLCRSVKKRFSIYINFHLRN